MKIAGRTAGLDQPFFLLAGPCAIESEQLALDTAGQLKEICAALDIPFVYKSSFDKANRSSGKSFRGPGMEGGLRILAEVKRQIGVPVVTDVHEIDRPVNIKKGQFLAPHDMKQVVAKARAAAKEAGVDEDCVMVCERGASFGYNNLVSDMRSLAIMRETGCPVVFDATHSVQLPGGQGDRSGGQREFIPVLARAAVASGVAGLFMETHPDPEHALSDGPNAWPLARMRDLLATLKELDAVVKRQGFAELDLAG